MIAERAFLIRRLEMPKSNHQTARQAGPQCPALQTLDQFAELIGLPLFCVEKTQGKILACSHERMLDVIPPEIRLRLAQADRREFIEDPQGMLYFSLPLPDWDSKPVAALGYALTHRRASRVEVVLAAVEQGWSQQDIEDWWDEQNFCGPQYLRNLLDTVPSHLELSPC